MFQLVVIVAVIIANIKLYFTSLIKSCYLLSFGSLISKMGSWQVSSKNLPARHSELCSGRWRAAHWRVLPSAPAPLPHLPSLPAATLASQRLAGGCQIKALGKVRHSWSRETLSWLKDCPFLIQHRSAPAPKWRGFSRSHFLNMGGSAELGRNLKENTCFVFRGCHQKLSLLCFCFLLGCMKGDSRKVEVKSLDKDSTKWYVTVQCNSATIENGVVKPIINKEKQSRYSE